MAKIKLTGRAAIVAPIHLGSGFYRCPLTVDGMLFMDCYGRSIEEALGRAKHVERMLRLYDRTIIVLMDLRSFFPRDAHRVKEAKTRALIEVLDKLLLEAMEGILNRDSYVSAEFLARKEPA